MKFLIKAGNTIFYPMGSEGEKAAQRYIYDCAVFVVEGCGVKGKKDKRGCGNYIGLFMLKKEKTRQRIRFYGARRKLFAVN